jgi:Contractile injection system tube protein/LysM domain
MIGAAMLPQEAVPAQAETPATAELRFEDGKLITCLFNPKDYTVTKSNNWKADAKQGATAGTPSYTGGNPWEISLQLLLDSTLLIKGETIVQTTTKLFDAMKASIGEGAGSGGKATTKRPPTVTFRFGNFSFRGVVKNLTIQYTLFKPTGEPVRADVKLSLMAYEADTPPSQNPTTRSEGGLGAHVVRDGDSLASIAYKFYGDATRWRRIAQANGIDDPLLMRGGRTLNIPRLDA